MTRVSSPITRIEAVLRTVPDIDAAERFYREALDCVPDGMVIDATADDLALLGASARRLRLRWMQLGRQHLALLTFNPPGRPYPDRSTSSDLWFQHCAVVVGSMARAHARVLAAGGRQITEGGPQHLPANTGGVTAFKFRDPFGHPLELLAFPNDVGDPVWHSDDAGLFLGIDHTAIAVSSSDASRRFYADHLGLTLAGGSRNRGREQTKLDAVPDDDVDVTALAPRTAPPHLELLGYRTGTRRPLVTADAEDVAVSRTLATGDIGEIVRRLDAAAVPMRRGTWFGHPAVTFADPDGHRWICRSAV